MPAVFLDPTVPEHYTRIGGVRTEDEICLTTGTPVDNQLAVFTDDKTIEGDPNLTWDGLELNVIGDIKSKTYESDIATGTSPLVVASTTLVSNLNADLLDGVEESAFFLIDGSRAINAATITLTQDTDFVLSGGINGMSIDGATFSVDGANNRVGIGTVSPTSKLEVVGVITATELIVSKSDAPANLILERVDAFMDASQDVGTIQFKGGEDGSEEIVAQIRAVPFDNWTDTSSPTALAFHTTPIGTTSAIERVRINKDGNVGVGTALTPGAKLHVDQPSTTAAIPVLTLDQADISEEMIEFITTIGTGNAIEAVGAKSLTTTHFIKVTIPGGLTRYFPVGTIA